MKSDDAATRNTIDEIANALQSAVLVMAQLQARALGHVEEVATLERALRRATATLRRIQPR